MKSGEVKWMQAFNGMVILAIGVLVYLLVAYVERSHSSPISWEVKAAGFVFMLGGLAMIADAFAMEKLSSWYRYTLVSLSGGGVIYLWFEKKVQQCSTFFSAIGIPYPTVLCISALGIGSIWLAYLALMFLKHFARGLAVGHRSSSTLSDIEGD